MGALLSYSDFYHALEQGHHAKVLSHLKHHAIPSPPVGRPTTPSGALPALRRWEKPKAMEVMHALLLRGARPNELDSQGRVALTTWLWLTEAPREAIEALLDAGADPLLRARTTPQAIFQSAVEACIYHRELGKLHWLLEKRPDLAQLHDATLPDPGLMRAFVLNAHSGVEDQRRALVLLLDHGASLDLADALGRTARGDLRPWHREVVLQWEDQQRAQTMSEALDATTASANGQHLRPRI